jgi:hypothetical protein
MLLLLLCSALAATLQIGPGRAYTTIADGIGAALPGDVVEIDSGEYIDDVVVFPTGDITVRGVGSTRPVLRITQDITNHKGIFVIPEGAEPVTVEFVHFEGAMVSEVDGANGAGIRMQGLGLTVRDCVFLSNQMGILTGGSTSTLIRIEHSEFGFNGRDGSGLEHNVYINSCKRLEFVGNYSHHAKSGHTLKTRAESNHIAYNRLMDELEGSSSYLIDIPEGGDSLILGNLIHQGPLAENRGTVISYNRETPTNPVLSLTLAHNTLVNEAAGSNPFFVNAGEADEINLLNNLFVGPGELTEPGGAVVTEVGNLQTDMPALVDQAAFDYHLAATSAAIDAGQALDSWPQAVPSAQYVHPAALEDRWDDGPPDVGAYGIGTAPSTPGGPTPGGATSPPGGTDTGAPGSARSDTGCGCATPGPAGAAWWLLPLLVRCRRS